MSSKTDPTDGAALHGMAGDDPVLAALQAAPFDGELMTNEERAAFNAAVEDYRTRRVEIRSSEEVLALLEQARYEVAE